MHEVGMSEGKKTDATEVRRSGRICSERLGVPPARILFPSLAVGVKRRRGLAMNKSLELSSTGVVACLSLPALVASSS